MSKKIQRRKCKCQVCGKQGWNDEFFRVTKGKRNLYYCNEKEYLKIKKEDEMRIKTLKHLADNVFELEDYRMISNAMQKELNRVSNIYNRDVVYITVTLTTENMKRSLKIKNFDSEYGMARYLITIVENNINPVWIKWKERIRNEELREKMEEGNKEVIKENVNELSIMKQNLKKKNNKKVNRGILDFLK